MTFLGACTIQDSPIQAVQMLWINLIMDSFASLALATEKPTPELLQRRPYGRNHPLLSNIMYKNIIGQTIYQLAILIHLIFSGPQLFGIRNGSSVRGPSVHFTIVFNSFVMMTLFNELNSRKVHGERNVFSGLFRNPTFCVIWVSTMTVQVVIVQYGGEAFSTRSLGLDHWLWCLIFGIGSLLWGQIVVSIPPKPISDDAELGEKSGSMRSNGVPGRTDILWFRGIRRIQTQLQVIKAFRAGNSPSAGVDKVVSTYPTTNKDGQFSATPATTGDRRPTTPPLPPSPIT